MVGGYTTSILLLMSALFIRSSVAVTPQMIHESNLHLERLHSLRLASSAGSAISSRCNRSLIALLEANSSTPYIDAAGKPGGGILVGDAAWLGSYGQCTAIPGAAYCLVGIAVTSGANKSNTPASSPFSSGFKWGLCLPKECSETDIFDGLEYIIKAFGLQSFIHLIPDVIGENMVKVDTKTVHCAKPSKYTGAVIATITLCGVVLCLCLCGTLIEMASECMIPATVLVGKNDGFMPITNETEGGTEGGTKGAGTERKFVVEFLLCFSLIRNTNRILDTNVPPNAITSINGMRVLSIFWVILGHVYIWQLTGGLIDNVVLEFAVLQRFTFQGIINAGFSVDSFFFLSGLLVAYLSLRQMEKTKGKLNLFQFYFHRFWRLTPAYMFVLLFFDNLTGFLGEGPIWYQLQSNQPCDKYWWTNLLYINNFYPTSMGEGCMSWSWYLANDMQFYVICPVILIAAYRYGVRGLVATVATLLVASFISTAVVIDYYELETTIVGLGGNTTGTPADFQSYVYTKPYCRISPYLVGIALGYLFHIIKQSSRPPRLWFLVCGWCAAIVLALAPLYGTYRAYRKTNPVPLSRAENIMYGTFSRCSWALALAWVVFASHVGCGGLVNKILSARFWIPLSRLTYCVYLVHPVILAVYFGSYQTTMFYSDMNIAWHFLAALTVSYLVAFMVSVTFELPMMQLEKLIFKTHRK